jgi:hypothetical protein
MHVAQAAYPIPVSRRKAKLSMRIKGDFYWKNGKFYFENLLVTSRSALEVEFSQIVQATKGQNSRNQKII